MFGTVLSENGFSRTCAHRSRGRLQLRAALSDQSRTTYTLVRLAPPGIAAIPANLIQ